MTVLRSIQRLAVPLALSLFCASAMAATDPVDEAAATIDQKFGGNVKKLFSSKCSWCHHGFGMKQADGPKLAGTTKSVAQVMAQIMNGKSPMPGFKTQLSFEEVNALAEYIKLLPAE